MPVCVLWEWTPCHEWGEGWGPAAHLDWDAHDFFWGYKYEFEKKGQDKDCGEFGECMYSSRTNIKLEGSK